ncbi:MAG: phospholipase D-like domain-containing protein [Syntrophobacteraceae bacterium]
MHNKLFIADNQVAIIGGRNIGDPYFGVGAGYNFRDFDLFSVGPVVGEISKSFDQYWNSEWAVPVRALYTSRLTAREVEEAYLKLKNKIAAHPEYPYKTPVDPSHLSESLSRIRKDLIWARAGVASDAPGKSKEPGSHQITAMLKEFLESAKREILIVTPYLVPSEQDILKKRLADFRSRGVAISVLTNSLASTDLVMTHVGYAKYRNILVEGGVTLHEMRPDAASRAIYTAEAGPASVMGLHGKAALVDRGLVFIGTFNFDQRSEWINTEVGVMIDSPELAQRIASAVGVDLQGQNSWRVTFASDCGPKLAKREGAQSLVWISEEAGRKTCLEREPSASLSRLLLRSFMGLVPIDSQL